MPIEPEGSVEVFHGSLIRVLVETWPEGLREIVQHPGAAAMVAFDGDDVILIRQLRQAIRAETLEIPAGILDREGESPRACAERELLEETGYRATGVDRLGMVHTSLGFTNERIELFICSAEREGEPEDGITVERMPFADALAAVHDGRITDAKSAVALLLAGERRHPGGAAATR
ncbi:MAG: NUDIX hydrolase [Actinomycetota bacterium]